ncbi:phage tail sheath subtilisin-like domain-containing protein [Kovacikia minuta CCNUW1]|uniref:phage tail sheath family protein n=1 Tax=Kovacikia minuta TaxID=2931930 RepID=UPI001CC9A2B4|nr:phage tail sheath C-terminal domain-containing protein [Kovacikia minuta]UBF24843.1 phage tail sheath subtilisin-like domain-containing protein [Kovacikia minuta CCNUW1]
MPVTPTYPGVYIEEIPSGVRTITGVATSITAFIGRSRKGLANEAVRIQSYADFERQFGGLWSESSLSYAVQQFFIHGGKDAIIVRVFTKDAATATIALGSLTLAAASPGSWGNALQATVDYPDSVPEDVFNLTIQELESPGSNRIVNTETFLNLSTNVNASRFAKKVLEQDSKLVRVPGDTIASRPAKASAVAASPTGADGGDITANEIVSGTGLAEQRKGLYALDKADLFNLLYIPPLKADDAINTVLTTAAAYCKSRRAILIIDPPVSWGDTASVERGLDALRTTIGDATDYAAVYFPRLKLGDPLKENRTEEFPPGGAIAGIIARTDAERGVWKAPAGIEATFAGVRELSYKLTDGENGRLNPLGVNCLRTFPVYGNVIWGARTLAGADQLASEWKYLPVRRLALFLEESLYRGTQWVVFEPNDEPLWSQIRLNIGAFMNNLFRQGAFQGKTPKEAYFVKCDSETTTQNDINLGIVNIVIGFAPLKPAEFVILKFQQMAGQIAV